MKLKILTLLLFHSIFCFGQNQSVPLSIGIGGGLDMISNKDLAASPLPYTGFGLPLGINGFKMNQKWINHFEVRLIIPLLTNNYPLKTKAKTQLKNWAKVDLRYQLLRSIGSNSNNFLGGEIKSSFFLREYNFLDGLSWELQTSLNLNFARRLNLSDQSFLLPQIGMPLLGYLNRKSALTFDEEFLDDFYNKSRSALLKYGKWKFPFDNWLAFELDILYHLKLSDQLNLQSRIGLNYYRIRFPEKVHHLNLPIRCYLNYRF